MTNEAKNVKRQKMVVEKNEKSCQWSYCLWCDGKQDLAMNAGSFAKASVEKEIMLKYLNMAVEKLEEELKLSRWFVTFIWSFCLILKDF